MNDQLTLRDITDAWHLCVTLGLTSPTAAAITDAFAGLLAVASLTRGHHRPAATLTATACVSLLATTHVWSR